jgi:hypothetical protein
LAANSLYQQHRRVTDTINRKQHGISAADEPLQYPAALFDTAIMVQKGGAGALGELTQVADLGLPTPDIEKR